MSLYQTDKSPYWQYDFQWKRRRFHGSTGEITRRRAKAVEDAEKLKAKTGSNRPDRSLDEAADHYWENVGRHAVNSGEEEGWVEWLVLAIGPSMLMREIAEPELMAALALRRGEGSKRNKKAHVPLSNATLNRQVTELYKRIHLHARKIMKAEVADIDFSSLTLDEPKERVRSLSDEEEERLLAAMREDARALARFSLTTGVRLTAARTLTRLQVDLSGRIARVVKKGGGFHEVPLTPSLVALLANEMAKHDLDRVFTYLPHDRHGRPVEGAARQEWTQSGLRRVWENARKAAKVHDFRWHDMRHTAATRLGDIKAAQNLLGHSDITTTAKYAHVTIGDLRGRMEEVESRNSPGQTRSRKRINVRSQADKV